MAQTNGKGRTKCHQGRIKKAELQMLRGLIETRLGGFAEEYKGWKFDNEFHRIYTYLRSYHLDEQDWHSVLKSLDEIQHSSWSGLTDRSFRESFVGL